MVISCYERQKRKSPPFRSERIKQWFFLDDVKDFKVTKFESYWIQMWINKKSLDWNPWDTDKWGKKRPCHIYGIQKMNEFSVQKQHQDHDKNAQKRGNKNQLMKLGKGSKGSYSSEYAKLNYRDPDLAKLANEGKGTTSSYEYS